MCRLELGKSYYPNIYHCFLYIYYIKLILQLLNFCNKSIEEEREELN